MKVSGKEIAGRILRDLRLEIEQESLHPHLAIILAGLDPSSKVYTNLKQKRANEVGIEVNIFEFNEFEQDKCLRKINELNTDEKVSGIIVQQPMFEGWDEEKFIQAVSNNKDVDGFKTDSKFKSATALAVWEMLSEFAKLEGYSKAENFLMDKKIVILGRGKTAGRPIRELLSEKGFESELIHSKTENPNEIIRNSDVVISATGRKHIIYGSIIKKGSFVVGVGMGRDDEGVFGDVDEASVESTAKLYCPTVGGIGPLTVVCLLRNVVEAAKNCIEIRLVN